MVTYKAVHRLYVIAKMSIATHLKCEKKVLKPLLGLCSLNPDKNDYFQIMKNIGIVQTFGKSLK